MPFESMQFRYSWRPYQKRVLDAIDDHLDDQRLHVVAAPGAGKTTLGLEAFRRLNKPALVLSPTRVIRDQWIDRLKDFTEVEDPSQLDWVSKSIDAPKIFTSITYQALHSKSSDELSLDEGEEASLDDDEGVTEEELNSLIQALKEHAIKVIILDEAHHLRAEWWRALDKVCNELPDIVLVSLTATPPYDAEGHEWSKYEQLCGPIDEEISVPELVKAGTLCAHQDYLWVANVTSTEKKRIEEYDDRVNKLCNTLYDSEPFNAVVLAHPWLHEGADEQQILKEPQIAIGLLSFMRDREHAITESLLQLLDLKLVDIPELGRHWWQVLIETVLFSKTFEHSDEYLDFIDQLKKQLRSSELLHKRELSLERSRRLERSLSLSPSKVDSCVTIHKLEYKHRGAELRQVILTDYIRDEALTSGLDTGEINLGAWPVFKGITSASPIPDQVGLLTGRISIIPTPLVGELLKYTDKGRIKIEPMGNEGQYQKVIGPLNQLTSAFTSVLMSGQIKTLVGTRSLLGEGWDAPAINSLILASSVGSFMLTNQMRGRAIRIDKESPGKMSSIWHLIAINAKSTPSGWSDFYDLRKRFETFVGLSEKDDTIESGFDRMASALDSKFHLTETGPISMSNRQMLKRYRDVVRLGHRWRSALTLDENARVIPSVTTPKAPQLRAHHLKNSMLFLLLQLVGVLFEWGFGSMYFSAKGGSNIIFTLMIVVGAALIYKLPKTVAMIKILFRHLPVDGSIKHIGKALLEALCQAGLVETSIRRIKVNVTKKHDGSFYLYISGCTFYESSLFADCVAEILAPVDNPRYLVVREGKFLGMTRDDYHSVPMKLGVKKELAQIFYKAWCKYVGPTELIYTRTQEGRAQLLKAKMQAFSSTFAREVKRQDKWQSKEGG